MSSIFEVFREGGSGSFSSIHKKCDDEEKLTRKQIVEKHGDLVRITQLEGKRKYSYKFGEKYPGLIVGHEKCKEDNCLVPKYMGWLWNVESLGMKKVRKGWCPGAIPEPVKEIMNSFLNNNPLNCDQNQMKEVKKDKPKKVTKTFNEIGIQCDQIKIQNESIENNVKIELSAEIQSNFDINQNVAENVIENENHSNNNSEIPKIVTENLQSDQIDQVNKNISEIKIHQSKTSLNVENLNVSNQKRLSSAPTRNSRKTFPAVTQQKGTTDDRKTIAAIPKSETKISPTIKPKVAEKPKKCPLQQ
ncbi:hypothetical protein PVAND_000029 [Polypedilum vanderplanki]|uniref:DUF4776 domain-containing protein n=1 Tax=Polypedilum vanderplanki TaxID=319348 RepID=A0A9J6BJI7_POLVA|nr:hypothetical protein PVAND_000029 [Polypedilum vanderplanki]